MTNLLDNNQANTSEEDIPEIKKGLWSIDSSIRDGQITAGEVDQAQEEFLKTTEWAK